MLAGDKQDVQYWAHMSYEAPSGLLFRNLNIDFRELSL